LTDILAEAQNNREIYPNPAKSPPFPRKTTDSWAKMQYRDIATNDIDELFAWGSGWDHEYLQLPAGPLGFRTRQVVLPDLSFEWNSYGQSVLFREVLREPALAFGVVLGSTGALKYRGREMAASDALVYQPGQEQEYTSPRDTKSLVVIVAHPLARSLGWKLNEGRIRQVPEVGIQRLVEVCSVVTDIACRDEPYGAPGVVDGLRDRVLTTLRQLIEPWISGVDESTDRFEDPAPAFRLVKYAEELMSRRDSAERLEIGNLAAELDVSQRTLYEAFRSWLGVGPYEYYLLRRMHSFREALLAGEPYHGKVKQAALSTGFHHVARLAHSYSRHFGESPRQTMKRRTAESGTDRLPEGT
jgi:AraC-like DNA-binding protein